MGNKISAASPQPKKLNDPALAVIIAGPVKIPAPIMIFTLMARAWENEIFDDGRCGITLPGFDVNNNENDKITRSTIEWKKPFVKCRRKGGEFDY